MKYFVRLQEQKVLQQKESRSAIDLEKGELVKPSL